MRAIKVSGILKDGSLYVKKLRELVDGGRLTVNDLTVISNLLQHWEIWGKKKEESHGFDYTFPVQL